MKICLISVILIFFSSAMYSQSPELVNSPFDEQNPILSPDGKFLYFTRANHPSNIGGRQDRGDIWYSRQLDNGSWSPPVHAGAVINSREWNGVLGFSADGSKLYLHHHYTENGSPKTQGIAVSEKKGNEWMKPENISIPYFKNTAENQSGWMTGKGEVIFLSIQSYGSRGAEDIYIVLKDNNGSYGGPVNLGDMINTSSQEFAPFYDETDSTLYFASNGRGGAGSTDIFFSKRLDNSWKSWSAPAALGDTVNTNGRELGFKNYPEQNFAIFASTQNSDGYGDIKIYRYGIAPPDNEGQRLFVINEKNGEFIPATVTMIQEEQTYGLQVPVSGKDLSSYASGKYSIAVMSPGYFAQQKVIDIGEGADSYTIALQPLEKGARISLENVLFEQSRAKLLEQSYEQLDQVVLLLKENPEIKIRLEGHTDTRGSAKANLKLSQMRVEAVKDYLVKRGINKRRIEGKGFGGEQPLYPEDTEESRMKNRRVEFVIID